ncbi:hypothetical protein [Caulobacter sp. FWC2]|uniref:hypothetical protein n=1 Tax=Caulobacter sp. FWC2 TaxID=69664 RepID=UPI000C156194|nr:hypothetical protein [Caulobacter sp. FWC2]PIB93234.1 hypothetical protein CSW62_17575 [Caulobacter sp. FWC2]
MSKLAHGLVVAAVAASTLISTQAFAQQGGGGYQPTFSAPQGQPQGYAPKRRDICGAPIAGQAPDIMTYDSATGTQVFVGGQRGGGTDVAAYNAQTGSAAGLSGDLSRPGLVSSCAVDGLTRESYGVTSDRPGQVTLSGRDDRGERYQFTRADGRTDVWDPRYENYCFRSGTGLFGPAAAGGRRC